MRLLIQFLFYFQILNEIEILLLTAYQLVGMLLIMTKKNSPTRILARDKLLEVGTTLFRQEGYIATSVDKICETAGVTKGAFFHHFKSKEQIGIACLENWDKYGATLDQEAAKETLTNPLADLIHFMDNIIALFADPDIYQSCLAGTIIHEIAQTNPPLKEAVHKCFINGEERLQTLLDKVRQQTGASIDTASLATLWISTMQGSFTLCKASGDKKIIQKNLSHLKEYILLSLKGHPDAEGPEPDHYSRQTLPSDEYP